MTKTCSQCSLSKDIREFYTFLRKSGGVLYRNICKSCDKDRIAKWQMDNPEMNRTNRRNYYRRHREQIREDARQRFRNDPTYRAKLLARCRAYNVSPEGKASVRRRRRQNKDAAFLAYGGYKCAWCGIADEDVLNIDHIGGRKALKHTRMRRGDFLYSWLKAHHYPPGFRVLCFNCNIKAFRAG